jgi:zinc finger of C3HC4-type, RING
MASHPLQSVHAALRSMYEEFANLPQMRRAPAQSTSTSTSTSTFTLSRPSHTPHLDEFEVPIPDQSMQPTIADLDLQDLDYSEPDSHLCCPICQVPFVDPVSVDCGHYFCAGCLARYWKTTLRPGHRKPCPACRTKVNSIKCAPRLIVNMCNDVEVKCPLQACGKAVARGNLESHMLLYCPERLSMCPDSKCTKQTKRKHLLRGICRHETHRECECGELVPLKDSDTHREFQCSLNSNSCEYKMPCPGQDFGCEVLLDPPALEAHTKTCPIAKMAPHLQAHTSNRLAPLQKQLQHSQQRVQGLQEGIDRILQTIETTSSTTNISIASPTPSAPISTHEDAEHIHSTLTSVTNALNRLMTQLDAHATEIIANETHRLTEELALISNGLNVTRVQVQWLLNRDRAASQAQANTQADTRTQPRANTQPQANPQVLDAGAVAVAGANAGADAGSGSNTVRIRAPSLTTALTAAASAAAAGGHPPLTTATTWSGRTTRTPRLPRSPRSELAANANMNTNIITNGSVSTTANTNTNTNTNRRDGYRLASLAQVRGRTAVIGNSTGNGTATATGGRNSLAGRPPWRMTGAGAGIDASGGAHGLDRLRERGKL